MASTADERNRNRAGRPRASVIAHPAFPAVVALWLAVLFGVGSLLIPIEPIERVVAFTGIADFLPAVSPPLGTNARLLIALAAAVFGVLSGMKLARSITFGRIGAVTSDSARMRFARKDGVKPRPVPDKAPEANRWGRARREAEEDFDAADEQQEEPLRFLPPEFREEVIDAEPVETGVGETSDDPFGDLDEPADKWAAPAVDDWAEDPIDAGEREIADDIIDETSDDPLDGGPNEGPIDAHAELGDVVLPLDQEEPYRYDETEDYPLFGDVDVDEPREQPAVGGERAFDPPAEPQFLDPAELVVGFDDIADEEFDPLAALGENSEAEPIAVDEEPVEQELPEEPAAFEIFELGLPEEDDSVDEIVPFDLDRPAGPTPFIPTHTEIHTEIGASREEAVDAAPAREATAVEQPQETVSGEAPEAEDLLALARKLQDTFARRRELKAQTAVEAVEPVAAEPDPEEDVVDPIGPEEPGVVDLTPLVDDDDSDWLDDPAEFAYAPEPETGSGDAEDESPASEPRADAFHSELDPPAPELLVDEIDIEPEFDPVDTLEETDFFDAPSSYPQVEGVPEQAFHQPPVEDPAANEDAQPSDEPQPFAATPEGEPDRQPSTFAVSIEPIEPAPAAAVPEEPAAVEPTEVGSASFEADLPEEGAGFDEDESWLTPEGIENLAPEEPFHDDSAESLITHLDASPLVERGSVARPFFDLDTAGDLSEEDEAAYKELQASLSLPTGPREGPRVTFAVSVEELLADELDEEGEEEEGEEEEENSSYGSLLTMKSKYNDGVPPAEEADNDAFDEEFGEGFEGGYEEQAGHPAECEESAAEAPGARLFGGRPGNPLGYADDEEGEDDGDALRDALLNLQRMNRSA